MLDDNVTFSWVLLQIGTDIEDTKCSWLIVQALKRADESQKKVLKVIIL